MCINQEKPTDSPCNLLQHITEQFDLHCKLGNDTTARDSKALFGVDQQAFKRETYE